MTPYYEDTDSGITIYHGDCREIDAWLAADVLVTDPPYGVDWTTGQTSRASEPIVQTVIGDQDTQVRDSALRAWGRGPAIVFGSWRQPRPANVRHLLIWHKVTRKPGFSTAPWYPTHEEIYIIGDGFIGPPTGTVIPTHEARDGANGEVARIGHPTPKPIGLMAALIQKCPPGTIADPFMGSGSTLRAAKDLGRRAIGIEIEERYCEIAAQRLAQGVLPLHA